MTIKHLLQLKKRKRKKGIVPRQGSRVNKWFFLFNVEPHTKLSMKQATMTWIGKKGRQLSFHYSSKISLSSQYIESLILILSSQAKEVSVNFLLIKQEPSGVVEGFHYLQAICVAISSKDIFTNILRK